MAVVNENVNYYFHDNGLLHNIYNSSGRAIACTEGDISPRLIIFILHHPQLLYINLSIVQVYYCIGSLTIKIIKIMVVSFIFETAKTLLTQFELPRRLKPEAWDGPTSL